MQLLARESIRAQRLDDDDAIDLPCLNRKLVAILMADVVAFSRLVQEDERGTLAALNEARRTITTLASRHCGRVVDTAGDSVLAEFPSVVGAVAAAIAFQAKLARTSPTLKFRIGIHLGDVIAEDDGTLFGDGVNLAARLQSLAAPGGILISRAVYDEVRGKLPIEFRSRGRYSLKNIRGSVPCFEVVPSGNSARRPGTWPWSWYRTRPLVWQTLGAVAAAAIVAIAVTCLV